MADALTTLSNLSTVAFVVSSMLGIGLGLTLHEITDPLRNARLVIVALVGNLVVVPIVAAVIAHVIAVEPNDQIGLVLLGVAAGAPFLPKLAQVARADVSFAVALMALLIITSVIYMPVALPLFLPGIRVDVASIVLSLSLEIILPLGLGLLVRWRWEKKARDLVPAFSAVANLSLALLLVLMLGLNLGKVLAMFGSGSILAIVLLMLVATATGYVLGGPRRQTRQVLARGTAQRNIVACFIHVAAMF